MRTLTRLLTSSLLLACGDDPGTGGAGAGTTSTGGGGSTSVSTGGGGSPPATEFVVGGERPAVVNVPSGFDPMAPTPLVVLLHPYGADAEGVAAYWNLVDVARERGLLLALPQGTLDQEGNRFWKATDACCDLDGSSVDDVAYLLSVVDEISALVAVDPKRIYFAGHSNGGFMSYRMACEASGRIAAIVSFAGASFLDPEACLLASSSTADPVSVLQIHGDADEVVPYGGGTIFTGGVVPSVFDSTAPFALRGGCAATLSATGVTHDLVEDLPGAETTEERYDACPPGFDVELWTVTGGEHGPTLTNELPEEIVDFLLAHSKP